MTREVPNEFVDWLCTEDGGLLRADTEVWARWRFRNESLDLDSAFSGLFDRYPEFRTLVDYRTSTSQDGKQFMRLHGNMRRATDLYIACPDIGPRFIIQHGHSTWIIARKIGSDFWVNQNVTIGFRRGSPIIGNRVRVAPSAVVIGNISIGDDSVIAPTAFVNFDVPPDSTVFAPRSVIVPRKSTCGRSMPQNKQ